MKKINAFIFLVLSALWTGSGAYAQELTGDSANGESLFRSHCSVCHSMTSNRVGPNLAGVYGRKAGTVPDFHYSTAVQSSTIVWDSKTIDQWLTGPQQFIPGQRMNFSISDPQKRADIIAYLKNESQTGAKK